MPPSPRAGTLPRGPALRPGAGGVGATDGFAQIPRALLECPGLSATAKLLYACVQSHANADGIAWPSIERLAEMAGCNRKTVMKGLGELDAAGWLERRRRGQTMVNVYVLKSSGGTSDPDNEALRSPLRGPLKSSGGTFEVLPEDTNENHRTISRDMCVDELWSYYREKIQPCARVRPTEQIRARLKRFSVEELKAGIDHFAADPWWMAHNATRGGPWFFQKDSRSEQFLLLVPRPQAQENGHAPVGRRPGDSRNPRDYFKPGPSPKGWTGRGFYHCVGMGCGWIGRPRPGDECRLCGTVVPPNMPSEVARR